MHKHQRRWAGAALVAGSAIVLSLLSAAPASAAITFTGQVFDAGVPLPDVDVYILWHDPANGWTTTGGGLTTTGADGTWSINVASLPDGDYTSIYTPEDSSAVFTSAQAWDGSLVVPIPNFPFPVEFSVAGGAAPAVTNFPHTLARNAGVLQVRLQTSAGTAITGSGANGFGQIRLGGQAGLGFDPIQGAAPAPGLYSEGQDFDGTLTLDHVPAGTYFGSYVDAENSGGQGYEQELLNSVTITGGAVTNYGSATLQVDGTDSVDVLLPSIFNTTLAGAPKVGSLLTAVTPTAPVTVDFQWFTGFVSTFNDLPVPIPGATSQTFSPTTKQLGAVLSVDGIIRAPGHVSETLLATNANAWPTKPVQLGDPNAPSVTITGSAKLNGKLKAHVNGGLPDANTSLQWYRNGAVIADADGSSYTATKADMGKKIVVSAKSTVQGHSDAVIPSAAVTIAQDKATFKATTDKSINTKTTPKVKVSVKDGKTGLSSTAKVRVYYTKTKYKTVTVKSGKSATAKLPKLKKGTTTIKVVYQGNSYYGTKTITIKVKVSK